MLSSYIFLSTSFPEFKVCISRDTLILPDILVAEKVPLLTMSIRFVLVLMIM